MIKRLHEITIEDVILLDATKSANVLKKYWFVPLWMCREELETLAKQIFESIGSSTVTQIADEFDKLLEYRKLQIYRALYRAIEVELGLKTKINAWRILLHADFKDSPQLEKIVSEIQKYSGISIKTQDDLKAFADFIQYKNDKYNEMFPAQDDEEKKEVPLSKVIYSVFSYMGEPHNRHMLLIDFLAMKETAEDRIKSQTPEDDGQQ